MLSLPPGSIFFGTYHLKTWDISPWSKIFGFFFPTCGNDEELKEPVFQTGWSNHKVVVYMFNH